MAKFVLWRMLAAAMSLSACQSVEADPPTSGIHPPPAPMVYIASLPRDQWTFREIIWHPEEGCSEVSCSAGYNADPLFVSVSLNALCCGQRGETLTLMASSRACLSPAYYVAPPQFLERMSDRQIDAFLQRKTTQLVDGVKLRCGLSTDLSVPTSPLLALTARHRAKVR